MISSTIINLTDINIGVSLSKFLEIAWEKGDFLKVFLEVEQHEVDVNITDWKDISVSLNSVKCERIVSCLHPLPLSLPWLPLFVNSSNIQTMEYDSVRKLLRIKELSTIKGLPFVDPYIITEWEIAEVSGNCHLHITLRFEYEKVSWLQSMVESNSHTELIKFFETWEVSFTQTLQILKEKDQLYTNSGLHYLKHILPETDSIKPAVVDHMQIDHVQELLVLKLIQTSSRSPPTKNARKLSIHEKSHITYNDVEKFCLRGLQEYSGIKLCVVIMISLYAKIEVAAFHGLKVDSIYQTILDQSASMSLIYCLVAFAEVIIRVSLILISSFFGNEPNFRSRSPTLSKVSRSTQTDFRFRSPSLAEMTEDSSPTSETSGKDNTWRDCEIEEMKLSMRSNTSYRN